MRQVTTFSAKPFDHESPSEHKASILIASDVPEFVNLSDQDRVFHSAAIDIESVLYHALPGGVYDQLLGVMLKRKSSHFIVSHDDPKA